jgi:hypothetical protein
MLFYTSNGYPLKEIFLYIFLVFRRWRHKGDIMCVLEGRRDITPIKCVGTEEHMLIDNRSSLPQLLFNSSSSSVPHAPPQVEDNDRRRRGEIEGNTQYACMKWRQKISKMHSTPPILKKWHCSLIYLLTNVITYDYFIISGKNSLQPNSTYIYTH